MSSSVCIIEKKIRTSNCITTLENTTGFCKKNIWRVQGKKGLFNEFAQLTPQKFQSKSANNLEGIAVLSLAMTECQEWGSIFHSRTGFCGQFEDWFGGNIPKCVNFHRRIWNYKIWYVSFCFNLILISNCLSGADTWAGPRSSTGSSNETPIPWTRPCDSSFVRRRTLYGTRFFRNTSSSENRSRIFSNASEGNNLYCFSFSCHDGVCMSNYLKPSHKWHSYSTNKGSLKNISTKIRLRFFFFYEKTILQLVGKNGIFVLMTFLPWWLIVLPN